MLSHSARLIATVFGLLMIGSSTQAQEDDIPNFHVEDPQTTDQRSRLAPWFADLDKKIQGQQDFNKVAKIMMESPNNDNFITCFLTIESDGSIDQLEVHSPQSTLLKESARVLIYAAAPFQNPPLEVMSPSNILIRFKKENGSVSMSSHLYERTKINGRIGAGGKL